MSASKKQGSRISRREFIKGSATVGATMAASGLLGMPLGATPAMAAGNVPDKWDEQAEVVVVGTGVAGYGAAIDAKDAGAEVMVIEKESWFGGNSLLAGGAMQFPVNHVQKAAGIQDTPELAYHDIMEMGEFRNSPEIVKVFIDNSADTALWFEKLGMVWNKQPSLQLGCSVPRTLNPAVSPNYPLARGLSEIAVLHKAATDRKIPVKLGYRLTRLIRSDAKSPVVGLEVVTGGKTINIKATKAVVLATGGFKANHALIRALDPRLDESFPWSGYPYVNTIGDGHFAASSVGAGFVDMSFVCEFTIRIGSNRYVVWEPQLMTSPIGAGGLPFTANAQPYMVLVENDGKRYCNEANFGNSHVTWNSDHMIAYLNLPKRPRNAWMVLDADGAKAMGWTAEMIAAADLQKGPTYLDPKMVATAPTLAELAPKIGVPAANLEATIKQYNTYVSSGVDKDFKRPRPMFALAKGPFFAGKIVLITHDQSAGMRVNTKMQVIDASQQAEIGIGQSLPLDQERIIPHLYAAGEVTGGLFGADRGSGKMGSYLVQGRVAGKNAAKETAAM